MPDPLLLSPKAAEIAAVARLLLAEGGYHSFSYADIAARVHISKPSIHHHFPSKAELVHVVVSQYRQEALAGMAALDAAQPDATTRLNSFMEYWSGCLVSKSMPFCICAMLAAGLGVIPSEVADEVRGHFQDLTDWLTRILEQGSAQGQLRMLGSAYAEAQTLMATVHGAMLATRIANDPQRFQPIVRLAIKHLLP